MFLLQTKKAWTKLVSTRVVDRELRERIGRRKYHQHMEQNPSASDLGFGTFIHLNRDNLTTAKYIQGDVCSVNVYNAISSGKAQNCSRTVARTLLLTISLK